MTGLRISMVNSEPIVSEWGIFLLIIIDIKSKLQYKLCFFFPKVYGNTDFENFGSNNNKANHHRIRDHLVGILVDLILNILIINKYKVN